MTFSIVAMDPSEDLFGVAVASRFIAVGAVVPWAEHGVGAIATQSYANYTFGPDGLALLRRGSASDTLKSLLDADPEREKRQVGIVDRAGNVASFTGKECMDYAGSIEGKNFTVQGNILTGVEVLKAMAAEMERNLPFIDRLISALKAGEAAGGDRRGKQGASILVAGTGKEFVETSGIVMNIRVDDHPEPVLELERISQLWKATFWDTETSLIQENKAEIDAAIRNLGYDSLESWAEARGLSDNVNDSKIGIYTLKALLGESKLEYLAKSRLGKS